MPENVIVQQDCIAGMKQLADGSVDMVFADPPFNLDKDYKSYADNLEEGGYVGWCQEWISECCRVLKPGGSLFLHNIPRWLVRYACMLEAMGLEFCHWIAWDAPTSPMGNSLQPGHYGILYYVKPPVTGKVFYELRLTHKRCRSCKCLWADYGGKKETIPPHGPLVSDVWTDISRLKHRKYRNDHPCQLPVHLLERIVLMATRPNDLVLDPFMGTGTTAVAAARLERRFIGFDMEPAYAEMGMRRVARQKVASSLNGIHVSCFCNEIVTVRESDIYDRESKQFKDGWKELFTDWPDTKEKRIGLNSQKLLLRKKWRDRMAVLETQLKENDA